MPTIKYYILKAARSPQDYFYLYNQVEVKDLAPFVIKAFLEVE